MVFWTVLILFSQIALYTISNRYLYGSELFRQFVYYFRLLSIRNDHPFTRNWSPPDSYARRNHIWLAGIFFPLSFGWLLISVLFFILFIYVLIASVFVVDFVLLFLSLRFVYLNEFVHDDIFPFEIKTREKEWKTAFWMDVFYYKLKELSYGFFTVVWPKNVCRE